MSIDEYEARAINREETILVRAMMKSFYERTLEEQEEVDKWVRRHDEHTCLQEEH